MYTVVVTDMVGYSILARQLEECVGSEAVALLHAELSKTLSGALSLSGVDENEIKLTTSTGDGEIRYFSSPESASKYAEAVHKSPTPAGETWYFRVGVATGEVKFDNLSGPSGFSITVARRLEEAAKPGEVLLHQDTYQQLKREQAASYGPVEEIIDKHGKVFLAHRKRVIFAPKTKDLKISEKIVDYVRRDPIRAAVNAAAIISIGSWIANKSHLFDSESSRDFALGLINDQFGNSTFSDVSGDIISSLSASVDAFPPGDFLESFFDFMGDMLIG